MDDSVYALPLIVPNLDIAGQRHNVMFVATMGNTVYAFDADDPAQSEPLWSRNLGTPAPGDSWIGPTHHGILGTPFIDVPTGTLYVVAMVQKDNESQPVGECAGHLQRQSEIQLSATPVISLRRTGGDAHERERRTPTGGAADGQRCALYRLRQHRARSETTSTGRRKASCRAFNARDLTQRLAVFQTTPSGRKGGIWQGGRGIATDGLGNIYLSTAGGYYDGVSNFGSSTLKFAGPSLKLVDWFTPNNHEYLFLQNIDMSAGGVTLIPNSPLMFSGGKEGVIFLLNRDDMGKLEGANGGPLQRFQAANGCGQKDCAQTLGTAFWAARMTACFTSGIDGMSSEPITSSTTASSRLRPP